MCSRGAETHLNTPSFRPTTSRWGAEAAASFAGQRCLLSICNDGIRLNRLTVRRDPAQLKDQGVMERFVCRSTPKTWRRTEWWETWKTAEAEGVEGGLEKWDLAWRGCREEGLKPAPAGAQGCLPVVCGLLSCKKRGGFGPSGSLSLAFGVWMCQYRNNSVCSLLQAQPFKW